MDIKPSPVILLLTATAAAVLLAVCATALALNQPWLGLTLGTGPDGEITVADAKGPARHLVPPAPLTAIAAADDRLALAPLDLAPEPSSLTDSTELERFFVRQDILARILRRDTVLLELAGDTREIRPTTRSLSSLQAVFWIQLFVGLGAMTVSCWVWSLRPRDTAARLFALSGVATALFTHAAAVYSTRELALPAAVFKALVAVNQLGASLFGLAMIALFTIYPAPLPRRRVLMAFALLVFGTWTAALVSGQLSPVYGINLLTLLEMLCICLLIGRQYMITAGEPDARAALTWLGLAVVLGAGGFIGVNAAPLVLGSAAVVEQGYAFVFFLLIHAGLAAGISRYRLFDLHNWAFGVLFYTAGTLLLLGIDAALVYSLSLNPLPALSAALFIVALCYLPLRDKLFEHFVRRGERIDAFREVLAVALAPPDADRRERWDMLLQKVFAPLRLEPHPPVSNATLANDGLTLLLPPVAELPSLRLDYAGGGARLFNRSDLSRAQELIDMLRHTIDSRHAFEEGVSKERARIAADIHDNVCAQLMRALHSREYPRTKQIVRETLSDLRDTINDAAGLGLSAGDTLADLQAETRERLDSAGVELAWEVCIPPNLALRPPLLHTLRSVIREAVSNIIRHSDARLATICLRYLKGRLTLTIEDDGQAPADTTAGTGYGLSSIRARIREQGGECRIDTASCGVNITAVLPFDGEVLTG